MDKISTCTSGQVRFRRDVASSPFRPGMAMSIKTSWGCKASAMATTAMPSLTSPTTSILGMDSSSFRTPARTRVWSSASKTRIGVMG